MVSERRNELLAETLHEIHLIEKWGRGISLILSKEPETDFKEVGTQFIVTFKRKQMEAEKKPEKRKKKGKLKRKAKGGQKSGQKGGQKSGQNLTRTSVRSFF